MSEQEKLNKKFGMVAMPFHFHFQKLFTVLPDILARNQCKKWNKNLNLETLWIMMGKSKEKGNYFMIFCPPQKDFYEVKRVTSLQDFLLAGTKKHHWF